MSVHFFSSEIIINKYGLLFGNKIIIIYQLQTGDLKYYEAKTYSSLLYYYNLKDFGYKLKRPFEKEMKKIKMTHIHICIYIYK